MKVLFFASLREATGTSELCVGSVSGGLDELFGTLSEQLSGEAIEALRGPNIRIAVDQVLVDDHDSLATLLADASELAFLPPVTGG